MSSETFDVNYFKLCIASQIQAGHDMFHDVNPYIPSVHNPSYEAKKAAKIRASYTLPSRTAARLNGDGKDSQQQPLLLQYSMEAENKRNVMSNALVLRSEGESAGSSARAGDGKSTGPAPTATANSNALITAKKGAQAAKVPVPKWHAPWELSAVISGHLGWVRSIAFDSSNEWFATGAADRTIKIWDLAKCCAGSEGGLRLTLTGHINAVRGLAVSQRHPYLFSVGEDKTVKCWDLEHNKVIRNYHGHLSAVFCCAVHPTLDLLITGGRDSVARVWDMRTKHQIHCLSGHTGAVSSVIANGVDPQIITASHDSTIKLWDIAAGKSMSTLTHHKKAVRSIVASPRELSFVSASADNIKKWQIRDGKFLRNMSGHNAVLNSLAVNDDGVMVSAGDNGSLNFWDYDTGYCFQQSQTVVQPGSLDAEAGIFASTFDLSGSRLLTCEADKTIKIWKENTDATEDTHPVDMKGWTKDCLALKRF